MPPMESREALRAAIWLALAAMFGSAQAQLEQRSVTPTLSINSTLTDNKTLSSGGERKAELITQISPGISLSSRRGALQGFLSYSLNGTSYASDASANRVSHSLSSRGSLTSTDGTMGVAVTASANEQIISPFGLQTADPSLSERNRTQVFGYSIAPFVRGRVADVVTYDARTVYSGAHTSSAELGDSGSLSSQFSLSGGAGKLGWQVAATRLISDTNGTDGRLYSGSVVGSLIFSPDIDWRVVLRGGSEREDRRRGSGEASVTWGATVEWRPGPRTSVSAQMDDHVYGRTHAFSFSHRTARTVWQFNDSRSRQLGLSTGRLELTLYDQLDLMLRSQIPDPGQRDAAIREYLALRGLDPNAIGVIDGFITMTPVMRRNQSLAVFYSAALDTFSLSLSRSWTESLGEVGPGSSLLGGSARQQGMIFTWSHRMSGDSSLVLTARQQRTLGNEQFPSQTLQSVVTTWSKRLGTRINGSLGVRHSRLDSDLNPYHESAVIGSLRMQF